MVSLEENRVFIVEELIKNGGSPVATQRAFRIRFALGRRARICEHHAYPEESYICRKDIVNYLTQVDPREPDILQTFYDQNCAEDE